MLLDDIKMMHDSFPLWRFLHMINKLNEKRTISNVHVEITEHLIINIPLVCTDSALNFQLIGWAPLFYPWALVQLALSTLLASDVESRIDENHHHHSCILEVAQHNTDPLPLWQRNTHHQSLSYSYAPSYVWWSQWAASTSLLNKKYCNFTNNLDNWRLKPNS